MARKSLYLVDLSSFIFRAYYAVRPLSSPQGVPVNAVYGVVTMLKKLIESRKPDHLVVCGDRPEKNFRYEIYPEYKANRGAPPEDLVPQFDLIKEFVRTWPIRVIDKVGFEADDVIATLVEKYRSDPEMEIFIVSQDKDLMQLVGPHVCLYDTMNDRILREPEVLEKFGVTPDKVVDVQSLCGDPTDNIPGIDGIGPKTAAKLIGEYGSLENLLESAGSLNGKMKEKIQAGREAALLSRKLVSLDRHVPLDVDWRGLELCSVQQQALNGFYLKLGFKSLVREVEGNHQEATSADQNPGKPASNVVFDTVKTVDELKSLIKIWQQAEVLAFDTETDSLDSHRANLVGISLCADLQSAYYIPLAHVAGENLPMKDVLDVLLPLLKSTKPFKVAQNAKYDLNVLARAGLCGIQLKDDTMIGSYLCDPEGQHNLDFLAQKYLSHTTLKFSDVVPKGKTFADTDIASATRYAAEDAWVAFSLRPLIRAGLENAGLHSIYDTVEIPLVPVLARMEQAGILIDTILLAELQGTFTQRMAAVQKEIFELAGGEFNINSPKQLGEILFNKLGLPTQKKGKTGFSTDVDVLTTLSRQHSVPLKILEYRSYSKLLSTYVEGLKTLIHPETGRVHTTFNQAVVATGRLSSTDPNLQNIPVKTEEGKRIREIFIAPPGHVLMSADYSQIELRLLAAFSGDPHLLEAYQLGEDIHARTAALIFGVPLADVDARQRSVAKTVNFGVIYGQSAFGLSQQLETPQAEAKHFIESFYREFPRVKNYRDEVLDQARELKFVSTRWGRRRYIPDINSANGLKKQMAERAAFNAIFQGSAADLIKQAMIRIDSFLRDEGHSSRMLLQVHDELVLEIPDAEIAIMRDQIPKLMADGFDLPIPLEVSVGVGQNWALAH